jgi:hypothetical protein
VAGNAEAALSALHVHLSARYRAADRCEPAKKCNPVTFGGGVPGAGTRSKCSAPSLDPKRKQSFEIVAEVRDQLVVGADRIAIRALGVHRRSSPRADRRRPHLARVILADEQAAPESVAFDRRVGLLEKSLVQFPLSPVNIRGSIRTREGPPVQKPQRLRRSQNPYLRRDGAPLQYRPADRVTDCRPASDGQSIAPG